MHKHQERVEDVAGDKQRLGRIETVWVEHVVGDRLSKHTHGEHSAVERERAPPPLSDPARPSRREEREKMPEHERQRRRERRARSGNKILPRAPASVEAGECRLEVTPNGDGSAYSGMQKVKERRCPKPVMYMLHLFIPPIATWPAYHTCIKRWRRVCYGLRIRQGFRPSAGNETVHRLPS